MAKDLFQISKERNVYSMLDTWAMLSPKLMNKKSDKALSEKKNHPSEIMDTTDS
jgi:hypothetical protein